MGRQKYGEGMNVVFGCPAVSMENAARKSADVRPGRRAPLSNLSGR